MLAIRFAAFSAIALLACTGGGGGMLDAGSDATEDAAEAGDARSDSSVTTDAEVGEALTVTRVGAGTGTVRWGTEECGVGCTTRTTHHDAGAVVMITAEPTNGTDSYFAGFGGGVCSGIVRSCMVTMSEARAVTARFEPQPANMVFITAMPYPLTLGAAENYDVRCNQAATNAGLNVATNDGFIALVSSTTSSAASRLGSARGFVRMDGLPFADETSTLLRYDRRLFYPIIHDENGLISTDYYVTGTQEDGDAGNTCGDWTVTNGSATGGIPGGYLWTAGSIVHCNETAPLLCMGNTHSTEVGPPTLIVGGKLMYVTAMRYVPGMGTPNEHCDAYKPAGAGDVHAVIAQPDSPFFASLDADATYRRPDGVIVGTRAQLVAREWTSGPWQAHDGTYNVYGFWTGDPVRSSPTIASTCGTWTDAVNGKAWSGVNATPNTIQRYYEMDCSGNRSLLCVEN